MCARRDSGTEYARVRILVFPLWMCVKELNWVASSSLALLIGREIWSRSPAGEMLFDMMSFSNSHSDTADRVSAVGFTYSATYSGSVRLWKAGKNADVPRPE
jgi:hypothetical protein